MLLLFLLFRVLFIVSLALPSDSDDKKPSIVITKHTTNDEAFAPKRSSDVLDPTSSLSSISDRNLPKQKPTKIPSFETTSLRTAVLEPRPRFTTPTAVDAPPSIPKAAPLPHGVSPQWNASTTPALSAAEYVRPSPTNVSKPTEQWRTAQPSQPTSHPPFANTTLRSPTSSSTSHSVSTLASFSSRGSIAYESTVKPQTTTPTKLTTANEIYYRGDDDMRRQIRTKKPKKSDREILSLPILAGFVVIGALVFIVLLILIAIAIRRQRLRQKEEMKRRKAVIAKKPRRMESADIYATKFAHGGALVLDRKLKGPVRHACDDQKTVSIHSLAFDPQLNEIVDIGSNVDVISVAQNTTFEGGTKAEEEKKGRSTVQTSTGEEKKGRSTVQKSTGEEKTPAGTTSASTPAGSTSTTLPAGKTPNKPLPGKSINHPPPATAQGAKAKASKASKSLVISTYF